MPQSAALLAAATSLAEWARDRRRSWTDEPLPARAPRPVVMVAPPPVVMVAPPPAVMAAPPFVVPAPPPFVMPAPTPFVMAPPPPRVMAEIEPLEILPIAESIAKPLAQPVFEPAIEYMVEPLDVVEPVEDGTSVVGRTWAGLAACATRASAIVQRAGVSLLAVLERMQTALEDVPVRELCSEWLMRGAAVVSTVSVVMLVGLNRAQLFARWDRVADIVVDAARPAPPPPAPQGPPAGSGRLTVVSANGQASVFVDGAPVGPAPVTVDLRAGAHRVVLRSADGSVERAVRVQAGESSELRDAIFPGWVALTSTVDLTLSENGKPLKRDERGWAILAPGPHDIQLDNRLLGVHEVRHVVVTPGDATRLSFAAQASTLSLTTNEPAEVWIDGVSFGQAPLVDQPISLGVHDVRIRGAVHERWVRIRSTVQPVTVNVDLTKS